MSDGPDLNELAQRYLDLWQDQVTALASDPDAADAFHRLLALMGMPDPTGQGAPGYGNAAGAPPPWACAWPMAMLAAMAAGSGAAQRGMHGFTPNPGFGWPGWPGQHEPGPASAGAASAADPSRHGAVDVDELLRRLAALEERVASLESGSGGTQRTPEDGTGEGQS